MTKLVEVTDQGHVRTIRLNRPEKKNALSQALAWGVVEAVDAAAADDNVWIIAITGSGDAFCAGLDLSGSDPYSPYPPMTAQLDDIG
ncbi:MAG: enoyl-CoA hydratase/isomerase family protein, partial [Mycobacterium sp.]